MREARQSGVVNATEFAVEIGRLDVHVRQRGNCAWIFRRPVETRPREKLHTTVVDPRRNAKAVKLDFVDPLRPRRRLRDQLGKLGRKEFREGSTSAGRASLDSLRGRTLEDTRHAELNWAETPALTRVSH
jgi:hypothetical protein